MMSRQKNGFPASRANRHLRQIPALPRHIPIFLTLLISVLVGIFPSATAKVCIPERHGLLYEVNQAEQTKTYHYDQVGSTIARTDDSGKVIEKAGYSAYGICFWKQGDMATPFLYNGQAGVQTDPNGLLHMRARYYSPYLMRFLNADPIGFSGGSNWFAYAEGNPISMSDPFGLEAKNWQNNSIDCLTGKPYDSSIYGRRPASPITSQYGHTVLDGLGLIPVLGEFADGANGIWYSIEGNKVDAGLSFAGMIPFAGWAATGGKALKYGDESYEILDGVRRAKANNIAGNQSVSIDLYDQSGATFLETRTATLDSLLSPRSHVDVSNMTNINRFADIHEGVLSGSNFPNIKVRQGTNGIPIQDVNFKY
jgi:RHS repeat-associated protein